MALIYFYDTTELDKKQLSEALNQTDHKWEFVDEKISIDNIDPEAEVISVFVSSTVSRQLIEAMPKLKLIACRSTGFNNIDFSAVKSQGITVTNVPTYGEQTVAEYAFTMLLALNRRLEAVLQTENQQFKSEDLIGEDLQGKVFGVIGTGHIGLKALQIANGFSMETIAYDVAANEQLAHDNKFKYVELEELLNRADVISLHVPYLPATHHLINRDRLNQMKPGAILVNTSRGELVDTKALIEILDRGHLGGACIDVVEGETLLNHAEETALLRRDDLPESMLRHSVEIDVLKKMPNVIISPHNAYNTVGAILRINNTTAKNIIDYWYGNSPNQVTPPKKPRGKLILTRHGESEWNASGKWTGITDIHLDDKGFKEAGKLGLALKKLDIELNIAYCSELIRSRETLEGMLNAAQKFDVEIKIDGALNERDYGDYTGQNKWQVKEQVGEDMFNQIRRGWDVDIPNGESLKTVYERVVPFYKQVLVPLLLAGENILVVAHGNSIRALMKYIDSISDEDIAELEMIFGLIVVYEVDDDGKKKESQTIQIDTIPAPA